MSEIIVVGAGFAGSVIARKLADSGKKVRVIDRRPHIGGNAYDPLDENGYRYHKYGPHIFHTNSIEVFQYLSRFTEWRFYEHMVEGYGPAGNFPIPANFHTLNFLFPEKSARYISLLKESFPKRSEIYIQQLMKSVGEIRDLGIVLHELIFKGYTEKQWGLTLDELGPTVSSRVPIRLNWDSRYFTDTFQFMPSMGYLSLFENLLDHQNISIELGVEFSNNSLNKNSIVFYSGSLDFLMEFRLGLLPYRSLYFDFKTPDNSPHQKVGQVNYTTKEFSFTRISEFMHMTGEGKSRIAIEYPLEYIFGKNEPFYPIPLEINRLRHLEYVDLARREYPSYYFLGRLASYRYLNMDQTVAQALRIAEKFLIG